MTARDVPPRWDRRMQQRLARAKAAALGELYDRFASLVHGLAHRVLGDERAADAITRDVFAHVWQHPDSYDPQAGPAAHLARRADQPAGRAAAAHHRDRGARPRRPRHHGGPGAQGAARLGDRPRRLHRPLLPAPLRAALELAYFQRRDYHQTAVDLGVTDDEARRRLRLGLQTLATAHDAGTPGTPPEIGGAA
ncbi:hypothetical protein SGRIM128S_05021 [Streptomyces griseomycini]